ncbi:MAG TPA: hydantoinase/oxoprolinase family protein, partial [Deltaproteobacteria bacterium]|nr:hydantoinase/oxoprolinase family protein [Deltaproteobacteria bacterium]
TPLASALNVDVPEVGRRIVRCMVNTIRERAMAFLNEVNSHPVYTIHEMLHPDMVRPEKVILIGGPAAILKPYIAESFGMACEVPEHAVVANALGAALARTTAQISLHADTQMGRLFCPELHMEQEAPRTMGLEDLKAFGLAAIRDNAALLGLADGSEAYVTEEQCFTMVRGFSTVGRNMRVRIQTIPGVLGEWRRP